MYGDPEAIRRLGHELRAQADRVDEEADLLVAEAEAVVWDGAAAGAMRAGARLQATVLRRVALAHRHAARSLDRHADRVAYLLDMIARIESMVMSALAAAKSRLADLLAGLLDAVTPLEEFLGRFVPPPPGSREWLTVQVPGLPLPVVR